MLFAGQPDADGSSKNHLQGGPVLTLKAYDRARCDDLSYIVGEGERLGSHRTPQRELQPVFTFVETNSSFQFFFFFFFCPLGLYCISIEPSLLAKEQRNVLLIFPYETF